MKVYSPRQAYAAWKAGEVTIVDVREQREYDTNHVDGMPLIPMSELMDRLDEIPTGKPLVMFCRSGNRSGQVADYLGGLFDEADPFVISGRLLDPGANPNPTAADVVAREKDFAKQQADQQAAGKPANVVEKIAEGKFNTWLAENVLVDQPIANQVKYPKKTVGQILKDAKLEPVRFVRLKVGELK